MKTLATHRRLETASLRKRTMGIFREIGATTARQRRTVRFERLSEISSADGKALKRLTTLLDPAAAFDLPSLRTSLRHGTTTIFVLRHRTAIVASATAVRFSTPTGRHCRIEDVVVDEKHRGKGIGRVLMERTIAALRESGVRGIELTSRPSRVAANALYKSLGFVRHRTNVYKYDATHCALTGRSQ